MSKVTESTKTSQFYTSAVAEKTLNLIEKLVYFVLKNIIIGFVSMSLFAMFSYSVSPVLFKWALLKFNIPYNGLSVAEELIQTKEEIVQLKNDLMELKKDISDQKHLFSEEKSTMMTKIGQLDGENKGLVEGIRSITVEKVNWWNIILTTAGITVVGGGLVYFLFIGSDADFFRPVIDLIGTTGQKLSESISKSATVVNENTISLSGRVDSLDLKLDTMKNTIDLISRKISELAKK